MNRPKPSPALLLLAALAWASCLAGCQSPEAQRLVGEWHLEDPGSLSRRVQQPTAGDDDDASQPPGIRLYFGRGGRLETSTRMGEIESLKSGTWKVIGAGSSENSTRIACILNDQDSEHEIEWIDQDTIKMVPPNMAGLTIKLTFRRQAANAR